MIDLGSYLPEELTVQLKAWEQPAFRSKQLFSWLQRGVPPQKMSNLPLALRGRLQDEMPPQVALLDRVQSKKDDTAKLLYILHDGQVVEGVVMHYAHGVTLCLSTQVGCAMGCTFCASTLEGRIRNLSASEMLGQVHCANVLLKEQGKFVHNIVLMGSGEPLDNYDQTVRFLQLIRHPDGLNIGLRNVSLSTCGLVPQMCRFADEKLPVTLSVSLHAPNDEIRRQTMPIAKAYPIAELMEACRYYLKQTGRRVIFEYALIDGLNSEETHAVELSRLLRGMQCHVNVIPLNPVAERGLRGSDARQVRRFLETLEKHHISATKRREMGQDIEGACGQLRRRHLDTIHAAMP